MISFSDTYYINPEDIETITKLASSDAGYPYELNITLKSGRAHSVVYVDKAVRDLAAFTICQAVERYNARMSPPSTQDIRYAVAAEVDKLRPYLRRIEKMQKEAKADE